MQHSDHILFLGQPPILRGAFVYGFNGGGLSVMHFRETGLLDRVRARESEASSMDFSERNVIRSVGAAACRSGLVSALRSLRTFGSQFYRQLIVDTLDTATTVIDRYRGLRNTNEFGRRLVTYWVNKKSCKFCRCPVARDRTAAAAARFDVSRTHEE
ncbi:hypothetical protein GN244_ATG11018 [Phytophthora infestans]|uniref:Uncharacterized protein n=1 Tax=Phytophthora infestans TaxID=4787 RepID=A0A833T9Y2_PHYIN|nr:hypothetical protein GN244_ATG11018 [Phytophthora infestans]KAF4128353.1 hypothetical protein GN958_ATG22431 [Phytophthora infestans]